MLQSLLSGSTPAVADRPSQASGAATDSEGDVLPTSIVGLENRHCGPNSMEVASIASSAPSLIAAGQCEKGDDCGNLHFMCSSQRSSHNKHTDTYIYIFPTDSRDLPQV